MMFEKKNTAAGHGSGAAWMITFADLLSLMLTFFVLLFSMSAVKFEAWKAVVDTMSDQFNPNRPQIVLEQTPPPDHIRSRKGAGLNLNYLQVLFERAIAKHAALDGARVVRIPDGVVIAIPANLLFDRKGVTLEQSAGKALRELSGTLVQIENRIKIAGHTDAVPVSNGKFRSNWELSMSRARIVAGILTDAGYNLPVAILGYADTGGFQTEYADWGKRVSGASAFDERIDIVIISERREKGPYDLF